jgi:hypothetical protein
MSDRLREDAELRDTILQILRMVKYHGGWPDLGVDAILDAIDRHLAAPQVRRSTMLIEELLDAADDLDRLCGCYTCGARARAAALRARVERIKLAPKLLSGEVQAPGVVTAQELLAWLTCPLDTHETPGKKETR